MKKLCEVRITFSYADEDSARGHAIRRWAVEVSDPRDFTDKVKSFILSMDETPLKQSESVEAV